jgi:hypothetical protein
MKIKIIKPKYKIYDKQIWLKQGDDTCSFLYALCNAKRFFIHYKSPKPGDEEWEALVNAANYRNNETIDHFKPAEMLGLKLERIYNELKHPAILTVLNPCVGTWLHFCLYVGRKNSLCIDRKNNKKLRLVGYRSNGPFEESVSYDNIGWPGPPYDLHWNVSLK